MFCVRNKNVGTVQMFRIYGNFSSRSAYLVCCNICRPGRFTTMELFRLRTRRYFVNLFYFFHGWEVFAEVKSGIITIYLLINVNTILNIKITIYYHSDYVIQPMIIIIIINERRTLSRGPFYFMFSSIKTKRLVIVLSVMHEITNPLCFLIYGILVRTKGDGKRYK